MELAITKDKRTICLSPKMLNRHGVVAGASGSGKTVTLKYIAEQLSLQGVPCFIGDIKGDLTGFISAGTLSDVFISRCKSIGASVPNMRSFSVNLWDIFGQQGQPITTSINNMGDVLLSSILELNNTQSGVMSVVFRVCADNDIQLDTIADLRQALRFCYEHADQIALSYGSVSKASIGAIQRQLLTLEQEGGNYLFTGDIFDYKKLISHNDVGEGNIHLLHCVELIKSPKLYACFLIWLLSQFYDNLPERGDSNKPLFVFFFDEAHLIFDGASKALIKRVEQIIRLIRSKGVGIYFCSQAPSDIPENILAQCGNRVQHMLRAATPKALRAVRSAAISMRKNPGIDNLTAIQQLSVGEALISVLDTSGAPTMTERAYILPPSSMMAPAREEDIKPLLPKEEYIINVPDMPKIGQQEIEVYEDYNGIEDTSNCEVHNIPRTSQLQAIVGNILSRGMLTLGKALLLIVGLVLSLQFFPFLFLGVPALLSKVISRRK